MDAKRSISWSFQRYKSVVDMQVSGRFLGRLLLLGRGGVCTIIFDHVNELLGRGYLGPHQVVASEVSRV